MQLMKSIFLLGLFAVQSLAEPIRVARSPSPAVAEYQRAVASHNDKRQNGYVEWPVGDDVPNVDMRDFDKVGRGGSIKTDGLASCIAIVVYNKTPQDDDNDKFLAHISALGWEDQLTPFFEAMDLSDPRVMIIVPLPEETDSPAVMKKVNEDLIARVFDEWEDYDPKAYVRDGARVNERGGSRLWVDGDNVVHWSVTGAVIEPR
ncbi:hypothetical protein CkaCkLH20_05540 [Colletotrichum karsti]|uniref:Uncharacterized protein n=1 Tax=Colletotrichum karsti TaxID=1095194 RepID=A0A9P6I5N0_9PEZI|nr:uncharacterized protein CkaCkLH20_05540 [Colletotrichum karsti]KAF9876694.1 hypothetical protein CkaCkLH20_05540 [Colletotrichum karsti]